MLLFHGFALDGRIMLDYSALGKLADREGFVVVSPTGTDDPHRWNTFAGATPDDVLFVNDLLDKLEGQLCIDKARVFATGYSNGGGMSMDLACNVPDRVKAVGLVAAVYLPCTPKTPLIAFHGTEDTLVAFEGGGNSGPDEGGFSFPPIRESIASWAAGQGCAATPDVSNPAQHVELSVYNGCVSGDGAVQFYVIVEEVGARPGVPAAIDTIATTQEIDASELIWQFFSTTQP